MMWRAPKSLLFAHPLRTLASRSKSFHVSFPRLTELPWMTPSIVELGERLQTPTYENPPNSPVTMGPLVNPPGGSVPLGDSSAPKEQRIYNTFYRTSSRMAGGLSCDWAKWDFNTFFDNQMDDVSSAEWVLKHILRVPGDVFPLAYWPDAFDVFLAFVADTKYYIIDMDNGRLLHFGGKFSSHDEFLARWLQSPNDIQYIPDLDRPSMELTGSQREFLNPAQLAQLRRWVKNSGRTNTPPVPIEHVPARA
ncbi:hypothetical protein C8R47DRAFT_1129870 [Mycena vitilis]|nr:hypothetical protein C8R47DRAFT_1129870 [Mycena vitilis]